MRSNLNELSISANLDPSRLRVIMSLNSWNVAALGRIGTGGRGVPVPLWVPEPSAHRAPSAVVGYGNRAELARRHLAPISSR
jgi:hypothetical protein